MSTNNMCTNYMCVELNFSNDYYIHSKLTKIICYFKFEKKFKRLKIIV